MISFYNSNIKFSFSNKRLVKNWIKRVIENHQYKAGDINIIFTNDNELLQINKQFLQHDYFTDIITFNLCEDNIVSGELYISIDTVRSNSLEYNQDFILELHRVIIHGILHLIGFDDHSIPDKEQMRKMEDDSLALLSSIS